MGMVLGFALFAGIIVGTLLSAVLVVVAILLAKKAASRRLYAWRVFTCVAVVCLPVLVFAVYSIPFDRGKPGSNYSVLFVYYFLAGLAYSAVPGVSVLLAFGAAMFCPVNSRPDGQEDG